MRVCSKQYSIEYKIGFQGTLMIGYQPLPYKGLANFFRCSKSSYRFPRVFGDEFGEKFGEKSSDSLDLVKNVVTILVMNLVNHHILCQIQ